MSDPVPVATVVQALHWLSRQLEADGSDLAHVPAQVAAVLAAERGGCRSCGGPVEAVRIGRPRVHCEACRPPRCKVHQRPTLQEQGPIDRLQHVAGQTKG